MRKVSEAFKNKKAFIAFITCGDPDLDTTKKVLKAASDNGVDLLELGIPFSDPTAEGPVIQEANIRALENSVTTDDIFDMVEEIRDDIKVPMVFMTYANVVFSYGAERFAKRCTETGISGMILPDVPYEEKEEFDAVCSAHGLDFISLIAPTSDERIKMIASEAKGFIYCVSSMGVTGTRNEFSSDIDSMIEKVREVTDTPCAIGFGISDAKQAKMMAEKSDGAIIGSAIIKIIAKHGRECIPYVTEFFREVSKAVH